MEARDFPISRLLWLTTLAECVVLGVAGIGLLLVPDLITPLWPWPLSPFTARALGAVYLAAFVATVSLGVRPWWSPARVVVPMVAVFTTIMTVLSLMHLGRYTNGPSAAAWLVVYVAAAAIALWHWWLYRGQPPAPSALPAGPRLRAILLSQVAILGVYGLLLLALGAAATGFWPWAIDDFHARIYSTAFLTPAVGALLLFRVGTRLEDRTLGATQLVSGVAAIAGFVVVDANLHTAPWNVAGTWLWLALCAAIAAVGLILIRSRPTS